MQWLIVLSHVVDLFGVAASETYMHVMWEKSVHAPVKLYVFVAEWPLLVGIAGSFIARSGPAPFGKGHDFTVPR
jgi:hypothetical protein